MKQTTITAPEASADAEAPAAPAPVAKIVGGPPRTTTVPLQWPVEYEGTTYAEVGIKRLTAGEVAAFMDRLQAEPERSARWPMYSVPEAVLDALDADDALAVNEAVRSFLPRQFQNAADSASPLPTGSGAAP